MKNKLFMLLFLSGCVMSTFSIHSCKKEKEAEGIDKQLLDMAKETNGFVWYKFSDALLEPLLRTRYNAGAATMLDSNGKIIPGSVFPDGSLIVKELYDNSTTLGRYAILYKKASDPNADPNGWVWGYINADESVAISATEKGSSCISCHSQANNIDYMLMNVYFP
jgi:hypothetical protein